MLYVMLLNADTLLENVVYSLFKTNVKCCWIWLICDIVASICRSQKWSVVSFTGIPVLIVAQILVQQQ